jgi:hyperosmotically inducible protein
MNRKSLCRTFLHGSLLVLASTTFVLAQEPATPSPDSDNTRMNQRDRNQSEPTADQQQANRSDRDITQQIRKAIVAEKSWSEYAHNVKVITQNGQVTLKGPVRSDDEKRAIEGKAAEIAGEGKVISELTVRPKS